MKRRYFWLVVENYYVDENISTLFAVKGHGFFSFCDWERFSMISYYKCYGKVEVIAYYKRGEKTELRRFEIEKDTFIDRSLEVRDLSDKEIEYAEKRDRVIVDEIYL